MIMAAVRAGVPVLGGNLPRARQREAMADAALDRLLDADSLLRQQALVRDGHCGLLPEAQIAPMTRIQLARDRSMAAVASAAVAQGKRCCWSPATSMCAATWVCPGTFHTT
jgi:hypothetical protein